MATSGSTNYVQNRNQLITEAAELCGIKDFEDDLTANEIASCARSLEMMVKHWQARDIGLWKTKTVYVFLSDAGYEYDLGPTGDHATLSFTKTETSAAAAAAALTISVDSIAGISASDNIGVELADGTLQWTTVDGAPSGTTVTLAAALTGAVAVDANVYAYTTIIDRPLYITDARLYRDGSSNETPVKMISRKKYNAISNKTSTGPANQLYYDPQQTNGKLSVWPAANSVKDYLILTARMPVEDFDEATNDPDFLQEWLLALSWNLACYIAPKFSVRLPGDFQIRAEALLQDMIGFDKDYGSIYFEVE